MAESELPPQAAPPVAAEVPTLAATDPVATMVPAVAAGSSRIAKALAAAQAEIKNPPKRTDNPHFKVRYADLAAGLDASRVLARHGIAIVQTPKITGDMMILHTRLIHESGEILACEWPIGKTTLSPQQMGSAETYARRYSLFPMIGIAGGDEDDDGEAASGRSETVQIDADQAAYIEQLLRDTASEKEKFLAAMSADSVESLTIEQFKRAIVLFERKKAAQAGEGQ